MNRAQAFVVVQFALFAVMGLALITTMPGPAPLLRLAGALLMLGGVVVLALAVQAYQTTNRSLPNVTPTPDTRAELVTSGIYGRIRHPIYTAVLLGGLGAALVHGHIVPLLVALALIGFFTVKARYEERLLSAAYPDYGAYMQRTGRFLPFL